ncbi:hypothetical protein PanWU01x14_143510 [Parasponia andersonii]|uniref:Uncharacterized protein n=1 Tax=Parasponia andersonii TaxID=3476 RepID=A0A2P5CKW5_PARAD|nr:hypothetical protein PanWU01x14_143510 [Parasponia andersonii]
MGNHSSSCFVITFSKSDPTAKLFDAHGNLLRRVKLPLKAAELMLEEDPGHVISPADELNRTGRFCAMRAEDELMARKSYLLVPLCKVNRKVSDSDMAIIKSTTSKKKSKNSSKVSPAMAAEEPRGEAEESVINAFEQSIATTGFGFGRTMGYSKGWKPALEPISEIY